MLILREKAISAAMGQKDKGQKDKRDNRTCKSDVAIQTTGREEPITLPVSDMIID